MSNKKFKHNIDFADECSSCGSRNIYYDKIHGELVCTVCGMVIRDIDFEKKSTITEDDHIGLPKNNLIVDNGLGTIISEGSKYDRRMRKLRYWNRRINTVDDTPSTLSEALIIINRIGSILDIPIHVRRRVAMLYRKLSEEGLARGRGMEITCSAIYLAICRKYKFLITIEEFANLFDIDKKQIISAYRIIANETNIQYRSVKSIKYIENFADKLDVSFSTRKKSERYYKIIRDDYVGKNPRGLVGACLYIASHENNEKRTLSEISKVSEVSTVTLCKRKKEIEKELKERGFLSA